MFEWNMFYVLIFYFILFNFVIFHPILLNFPSVFVLYSSLVNSDKKMKTHFWWN